MTTCSEIMTSNPKCHELDTSIALIAKTMRDNNIGPVPIVDGRESMKLVGVITDRDITVKVIAEDKDANSTKVADVMTKYPKSCKKSDDIQYALTLMEDCQIRRVPVVDDKGKLVGIIAQADIATRLKDSQKIADVVEAVSQDTKEGTVTEPRQAL